MKKSSFRIAIALVRNHERWLVTLRPTTSHLGGLWEFPGGKIEPGETPEQAAIRELREECSLTAEPAGCLPEHTHEYDDRLVTIYPILCTLLSDEVCSTCDTERRWVSTAELAKLEMPAANKAVIVLLKRWLGID